MNQLEQLRLIARKAGAGTIVLDYEKNAGLDVVEYLVLRRDGSVNIEVLSNLLELARIVSAEMASLAAERRTDEDIATLDLVVRKLQTEKNVSQLLWLDFDFNWALAGPPRATRHAVLNSARSLLNKYSHLLGTSWCRDPSARGTSMSLMGTRARRGAGARSRALDLDGRQQRFFEAVERAAARSTSRRTDSSRFRLVEANGSSRAPDQLSKITGDKEHGTAKENGPAHSRSRRTRIRRSRSAQRTSSCWPATAVAPG